ncbi:MAG TPA: ABC transporter permease, partial [Acidimicrobiia bacterium]|nr:ABC transporter permease [Acidimicrobiia bacterium]
MGSRGDRRYLRAALRSVGLYGLTLVAVVVVVFTLPRAMPGDPLSALNDPDNAVYINDAAVRARVEAYYGLDQPLPRQFEHYVGRLAHGDLGFSIERKRPVSTLLRQHLPWTLLLMGVSIGLASLLSFLAGVAATWRRGRWRDRSLLGGMTVAQAIPEYALAAVLLIVFAVVFPIFPLAGARTPFAHYGAIAGTADVARHLVLPAGALTLSLLGTKFLFVRNTMISALGADYMVLAQAKGLPDRLLKYRHAGRNALLPFLTVIGIQAGYAVGGAVFVESVFAYPGMGSLILEAVEARDYPVLEATFLVLAVVVLAVNLALEL